MGVLVIPSNGAYAGGTRREEASVFLKVKTTTNLKMGVAVVFDTTEGEIKAAGTGSNVIIGWLGARNETNPEWDPTTAPAAGDVVEVFLKGSGAWVVALAKETCAGGDQMVTDSTGRLVKAAALAVAVPSGGTTVTSDAAQPNLTETGSLPPGGETTKVLLGGTYSSGDMKILVVA